MRIPTIIALAAAVGLAASGAQAATSAHSPKPLVSLAKARAIALKLAPGRIPRTSSSPRIERSLSVWCDDSRGR